MLGTHLRPIGIQFFGDECGKPSKRALSKLNMLDEHCDKIIAADANERIRYDAGRSAFVPKCARDSALAAIEWEVEADD
jgi:hypothetical protein